MSEKEQETVERIPVIKSLKLLGDGTEGVLMGSVCKSCGEYSLGLPAFCARCSSSELQEVELSKEGILRTYTVIYVPPPGWNGDVPYTLGQVMLPEGPDVLTEVIDCPREDIKIGMRMELALRVAGTDDKGNEIVVHKWRPVK